MNHHCPLVFPRPPCPPCVQTERDVSVRQRAADLLYAMCDRSNAKQIVAEMLSYLETADYSIREEMVGSSLLIMINSVILGYDIDPTVTPQVIIQYYNLLALCSHQIFVLPPCFSVFHEAA